jgi:hypothetical protein
MNSFQCQSVSVSKQCHARCSRIQCQLVPRETIGDCGKISMSDQRAGRAITIGRDADETWWQIPPKNKPAN